MTPCQTHQVILSYLALPVSEKTKEVTFVQLYKYAESNILLVTFNNVENHFSGYKKVMFISFTKLIGFSNKIFCLYKIENYSNNFLKYDFY